MRDARARTSSRVRLAPRRSAPREASLPPPRAAGCATATTIRLPPLRLVDEDGLLLVLALGAVDDARMAARIEERLAAVLPAHAVVLVAGRAQNFENLTRAAGLADVCSFDLDQVADLSMPVVIAHRIPPRSWWSEHCAVGEGRHQGLY